MSVFFSYCHFVPSRSHSDYNVSFLVVPASPEGEEHQLKQEKEPSPSSLLIISWSPGNLIINVVTASRKRMKSSRKNKERKARESEAQITLSHFRHVNMFISSALRNRLLSVSFGPSVQVCAGLCWSGHESQSLCSSSMLT